MDTNVETYSVPNIYARLCWHICTDARTNSVAYPASHCADTETNTIAHMVANVPSGGWI